MKQKPVTSATIGAQVHDARTAAGLSQSELGKRVGASRFWVAEFEKGKPTVELGLVLKAIQTLGLTLLIAPDTATEVGNGQAVATGEALGLPPRNANMLAEIIESATPSRIRPSTVGWPAVHPTSKPNGNTRSRTKA